MDALEESNPSDAELLRDTMSEMLWSLNKSIVDSGVGRSPLHRSPLACVATVYRRSAIAAQLCVQLVSKAGVSALHC